MPELSFTIIAAAALLVFLAAALLAQTLGVSGIVRWAALLARLGAGALVARWLFYPAVEIVGDGAVSFGGWESTIFSVPADRVVEVAPVVWLVAGGRLVLGGGFFAVLFMPYYERWAALEAGSLWRFWAAALIVASLFLYVAAVAVFWIFYK